VTVAWDDEGIVLARRRYQETALWVSCFTFEHGRHPGWVPGGASSKQRATFEPGNRVALRWQARLAEHLGRYAAEPMEMFPARLLDDNARLAGMQSALSLVESGLAEREAHPTLYAALVALLRTLAGGGPWRGTYLRFELVFLAETGFALALERCAVTGVEAGLAFVSPRTGRAVAKGAAPEYEDRLLPLPAALVTGDEPEPEAFAQGLRLTGHFIERQLYHMIDRAAPAARERLARQALEALQPTEEDERGGVDP
jgi:DNA repair protein RecO (recombination protein O)